MNSPACNCCGCSRLQMLRTNAADPENPLAFFLALNTTGPLVDFPTNAPTAIKAVSGNWQFVSVLDPVLGGFLDSVFGGGTSKLDLSASTVIVYPAYYPLLPLLAPAKEAFGTTHPNGSPPTGSALSAAASVSLYDEVTASLTMHLIARSLVPTIVVNPQSGFSDIPEPASGNLAAYAGTPLSGFVSVGDPGIASVRSYAEAMLLYSAGGTDRGWLVLAANNESGFALKRVVSLGASNALAFPSDSSFNRSKTPFLLLGSYVSANEEAVPNSGLFTAAAHRGDPAPGNILDSAWFPLIAPANKTVTVYRNGEQVFSAHNPTTQQINDAKTQDGVYLIVTECDERSMTQPIVSVKDTGPRLLKDFSSDIRDSVPPAIGFTAANDVYYHAASPQLYTRVMATEPVTLDGAQVVSADEDTTSVLTRPSEPSYLFSSPTDPLFGVPEPGAYTLGLYRASDIRDIGNNAPSETPTFPWTVHAPPFPEMFSPSNIGTQYEILMHTGSVPRLEDPGLQTREHWRPRLPSEPVSSLKLTFTIRVRADQVNASQLTLKKNGQVVTGCTMTQTGDQEWLITIPTAQQTPRSFWMLTYDPGGTVFRGDPIPGLDRRYGSREEFPDYATIVEWFLADSPDWFLLYRRTYIHPDENGAEVRYRFAINPEWVEGDPVEDVVSYIQLAPGEYPRDANGNEYTPEPSVLATRVSWLMADSTPYLRPLDTSGTVGARHIGRVASISANLGFDAKKRDSLIGTTAGMRLASGVQLGEYVPLINHKGYTPSVPSLTSPAADCSYPGLTTTIDPCPPANVSQCAAFRVAQKHASAIRCDNDIAELRVSFEINDTNGNPADLSAEKYGTANNDFSVGVNDNTDAFRAAVTLMAKSGQPYVFGATLDGEAMPQNVWSCAETTRATALPTHTKTSALSTRTHTSYTYRNAPVSHTWDNSTTTKDFSADFGITEPLIRFSYTLPDGGDWITSEDDLVGVRGGDDKSGKVRKLVSGEVKQASVQGCLSVWRDHKTFPALKTATLGELCVRLSMRMTMTATINYEDRKLKPKLYFVSVSNPGDLRTPPTWPSILDTYEEVNDYFTGAGRTGIPGPSVTAFSSWDEGESVATKTVTHTFVTNIKRVFSLTKEAEERLATGQAIYLSEPLSATSVGRWKIQKV